MYCGMSLARVGLDFRPLLAPVFEGCVLDLFARSAQVCFLELGAKNSTPGLGAGALYVLRYEPCPSGAGLPAPAGPRLRGLRAGPICPLYTGET